ncbi:helix-turn-helix domain-containing protein [Streptomyces mobaraensis]|uniref:helix-turn-helix domain-containing protein n=1 Tax=Streptomyces mobaraensis TaxID=35621 RepID=UPI001F049FAE|nr:helix-turn-helix domain-containing protein [Streptomyces mobaraensis]
MSVPAPHAPSRRDLGALIRGGRGARRPKMTQPQLAAIVGYSASWVCRVEAGEITPPTDILRRIAAALDIPADELITAAHPPERERVRDTERPGFVAPATATVTTGDVEGQQEDAVRRRGFLNGAVGIGAAVVTGTPAAAADRPAADPGTWLEKALFAPPPTGPVPLEQLDRALQQAREDFRRARYDTLGAELPALLAAADATRQELAGHAREQACALAAYSYSLAGELAVKQRSEVVWVASDRALAAARACGQPAPLGEATRMLSVAMRHAGRHRQAVDLLMQTGRHLADDPTPQARAVRAAMLLTCAYTAAHYGDRAIALDMVDEAQDIGRRIHYGPGLKKVTIQATREQCETFRLGVFNKLGVPDEGVTVVRRVNPREFPTAERRARFHTDAARMWHQLGNHERTFASLRAIEREAPEEACRPSVKALTADLLYSSTNLPGMREFAARTGTTV